MISDSSGCINRRESNIVFQPLSLNYYSVMEVSLSSSFGRSSIASDHFFSTAQVAHLTSAISTLAALGHQPGGDWTESSVVDLPSTLYHPAYTRFFAHEKLADYPVQLNELSTLHEEIVIRFHTD